MWVGEPVGGAHDASKQQQEQQHPDGLHLLSYMLAKVQKIFCFALNFS